jgi:hypothetical protein
MNLSQFIEESLVEICGGIENANKQMKEKGIDGVVNPEKTHPMETTQQFYGVWRPDQPLYPTVQLVKFDVAVYAKEGTETKGGIGIMVATIGLGFQGKSDKASGTESRLQFGIPVLLPQGVK